MKELDETLTRQSDIIPAKYLDKPIIIIGAGAIGSWVTLSLVKMGVTNILIYDFDTVSIENMNSQFYPIRSMGNSKVLTLQAMINDFTGKTITVVDEPYDGMITKNSIVISAVDSMRTRAEIWDTICKSKIKIDKFIDPRMGAESALLYTIDPKDKKDRDTYSRTLYGDAEAVQERCTAKATIYTANLLAGLVCKTVKDIITKKKDYIRVSMWDIAQNQLQVFTKQK